MWSLQPPTPTPAPRLHLLRRTDRLPRWAAPPLNSAGRPVEDSRNISVQAFSIFYTLFLWIVFSLFYLCQCVVFFSFVFLTLFLCVRFYLLCCSVTRSRSSLSLVYVSPLFFFFLFLCMQAEWAGGTSCLCGLHCSSESISSPAVLQFIVSPS